MEGMTGMQKALAIKLGIITAIALLLLIPIALVKDKIAERASFKQIARDEITRSWTGAQQLMTPVLVLPYVIQQQVPPQSSSQENAAPANAAARQVTCRTLLIPVAVDFSARLQTEERSKGIYRVPVYSSAIEISGHFDRAAISAQKAAISQLPGFVRLQPPYLALVISDPRGIGDSPKLSWDGEPVPFIPGSGIAGASEGVRALLAGTADPISSQSSGAELPFELKLTLKGMESLRLIPAGLDTQFNLRSNWSHPKFDGAFLPVAKDIDNTGFSAQWKINQFSSNIQARMARCAAGHCKSLSDSGFGVSLIEPVDIYVQADRSTKYGLLFVGLSFIAFFMFEVLHSLRIHAIQYSLVGLAIAVFYLLLISLSEHISFAKSYGIAATACVSLLGYYVKYVLGGMKGALLFCGMLSTLYLVLYVIIQAEDFALLGGSVLVFAVLAIVMAMTRNIDWYKVGGSFTPADPAKAV
jgi:inner membrane protein